MTRASITDRLASGEKFLMDGGTGSEVQRRGADVLIGATAETELLAWSATANIDYADVVQQVHQDYLRCGADVLISNNFWTTRGRLDMIGLGDRWEEYAEAAAHNAIVARDAMNEDAYVAGGMAPPIPKPRATRGKSDCEVLGRDVYYDAYRESCRPARQGRHRHSSAGVHRPRRGLRRRRRCLPGVRPARVARRPARQRRRHHAVRRVLQGPCGRPAVCACGRQVDAILIMCTRPEPTDAALEQLREAFDGVVGAYPNVGYNPMAPVRGRQRYPARTSSRQPPRPAFDGRRVRGQVEARRGCSDHRWLLRLGQPEHILAMRPHVKGA